MSLSLPLLPTGVVRGACPHDCPDTCAMLVHVEDGRAVRVQGDPVAPGHAGVPLHEGEPLRGAELPPRPPHHPACGGWAGRARGASSPRAGRRRWTTSPRGSGASSTAARAAVGPPLLVRRDDGAGAGRLDGPPLLPPARGEPAGAHHLRGGGHGGVAPHLRRPDGARRRRRRSTRSWCSSGEPTPSPPTRTSGRRSGARGSAGRALVAIDPIRTRTAAQCDLHLAAPPRHRRRPRARDDARDPPRRPGGHATTSGAHTAGWEVLPDARGGVDAGADGGDDGAGGRGRSRRWRGSTRSTRPSFIRLNYGMQRHAGGGMAVRVVSLLPARHRRLAGGGRGRHPLHLRRVPHRTRRPGAAGLGAGRARGPST